VSGALSFIGVALGLSLWPVSARAVRVRRLVDVGRLHARPVSAARWRPGCPRLAAVRPSSVALIVGCTVGAATAPCDGVPVGASFGITAYVIAWSVAVQVGASLRRRETAARGRELDGTLALLCAELDAGRAPSSAISAAGVASRRFGPALEAIAGGQNSDVSSVIAELRPVAVAWQLAATTGAPFADTLARVRSDVAARQETARALSSALAGPRSSAVLLALLPALGVALGAAMGADPAGVLLGTPIGRILLCAGAILDAAGVFWTERLISSAESS
jgi:tight adherence protein B